MKKRVVFKRVVFTFDGRSLGALTELSGDRPLASGLRDSLQIMAAIQSQAALGFRELAVRNPRTGHERVLIVPSLQNSQFQASEGSPAKPG